MEYRTYEQFEDLCESMVNGNWQQAGEDCAKYGFWANDLIEMFERYEEDGEHLGVKWSDFIILVEIANNYRE